MSARVGLGLIYKGAQKDGIKGLVTGMGKGVAGVLGHSVGAVVHLVGGVVKGASNTIKQLDREVLFSCFLIVWCVCVCVCVYACLG